MPKNKKSPDPITDDDSKSIIQLLERKLAEATRVVSQCSLDLDIARARQVDIEKLLEQTRETFESLEDES